MEFGDFLGHLSNQTGNKLSLPDTEEIMQKHLVEEEQEHVNIQQQPVRTQPAPTKPAPKKETVKMEEESKEETIERIYEATSAILKTLRQAFPNKEERKMAFESIQNAIGMALNEGTIPSYKQMPVPNTAKSSKRSKKAAPMRSAMNGGVEELEGQIVDLSEYQKPLDENIEEIERGFSSDDTGDPNYSRAIDIQPGQGLTGVSESDIADLQVLAGIKK